MDKKILYEVCDVHSQCGVLWVDNVQNRDAKSNNHQELSTNAIMDKAKYEICDLHYQCGVIWVQHRQGSSEHIMMSSAAKSSNQQALVLPESGIDNADKDSNLAKRFCKTCSVWCCSGNNWDNHINSQSHIQLQEIALSASATRELIGNNNGRVMGKKKVNTPPRNDLNQKKKKKTEQLYCDVCLVTVGSEKNWKTHLNGSKHRYALILAGQKQKFAVDPCAPIETEVKITNHDDNGQIRTKKDEAQIAVHDISSGIITFQQSIGGTSDLDDILSQFEHLSMGENQAADVMAKSLFEPTQPVSGGLKKTKEFALFKASTIWNYSGGALFGHLLPSQTCQIGEGVYLNTNEPFCFVTVGVQGAGKSHTTSCVLESCLVPFKHGNIVKLTKPMTSLVLHYDHNPSSICEAAGLLSPNQSIDLAMARVNGCVGAAVPQSKAVILVSPAYYIQRKKFYGDYCTVKPLLFRWHTLGADHIKRIMRIESGDNQLYVAVFLNLLRDYQRKAVMPEFTAFLTQVRAKCNVPGQGGPLDQRIALLESVVAESAKNRALIDESLDLFACSEAGYHLIIADLTDPLLSKEEANGVFQVLTEQFRTLPTKGGKVLCLDEAHKYMSGEKADGLSEAIVNVARLMRHDGIRLVVSTQSPKALAPELLELVTVAALHHFHSPDWWNYLKSKLPLHQDAFERILSLGSGEAVAFATSHNLSVENVEGSHCLPIRIRPRLTEDLGNSRQNS